MGFVDIVMVGLVSDDDVFVIVVSNLIYFLLFFFVFGLFNVIMLIVFYLNGLN